MCDVGGACSIGWKGELPAGCPPETARNTEGDTYYRLLEGTTPTATDFLSYKERGLPTTGPECEARALSLVTHLIAAKAKLLPRADRWRSIGKVTLPSGSGVLFVRRTHVSWWRCGAHDPLRHCVVID